MPITLPLYSRGRPLKNLIADWKSKTGNSTILVENFDWTFQTNPQEPPFVGARPTSILRSLYDETVAYWYFSEIGFDNDDIFVKRFNDIFRTNSQRFEYLLNSTMENGYSWEKLTKQDTLSRRGTDTDSESGSRTTSHIKGGTDTFEKGVTTTSNQETSNEGNKLGRNTPNETLGVSGTSNTVVSDTGSDRTIYGGTTSITETPNVNKEKTYNSSFANNLTQIREQLTIDEFKALESMQSIYKQFALLFENLFMGVF